MRLLTALLVALIALPQFASERCERAEKKLESVETWHQLRMWHRNYAQCDDGDAGDLLSAIVIDLLADHWDTLPKLQKEAKASPKFRAFVIDHIDITSGPDDLPAIIDHATHQCPAGSEKLCESIRRAAAKALKEATP